MRLSTTKQIVLVIVVFVAIAILDIYSQHQQDEECRKYGYDTKEGDFCVRPGEKQKLYYLKHRRRIYLP